MARPNLYHSSCDVDMPTIKKAHYDVFKYIDYLKSAIQYQEQETYGIKVSSIKDKKKKDTLQFRVLDPSSYKHRNGREQKKAEKGIELLFNDKTEHVFQKKTEGFRQEEGIRILSKNSNQKRITLSESIDGKDFIFLRPDTYQLRVQMNALKALIHEPLPQHQALLRLFSYPDSSFWNQSFREESINWRILTDDTRDGTAEQRSFVQKALQTNDFALLEGPPGSGKTTSIVELIIQLTNEGKRVMLCSATHAAIDNVIERVTGKYRKACQHSIIPVRISSSEDPVKENVRPYLLQNLKKTYTDKMLNFLDENHTLESQQYLQENIKQNREDEDCIIRKTILESANLVGGTSVGILQHPDIKANKMAGEFDVLIVDEASKVTFADFIVPALQAKKWVLVGDVKQLSPYVEDDHVTEYLKQLVDEKDQKKILNTFALQQAMQDDRYSDHKMIYCAVNNAWDEHSAIVDVFRGKRVFKCGPNDIDLQSEIHYSDIIVCDGSKETLQKLSERLSGKGLLLNMSKEAFEKFNFSNFENYRYWAEKDNWGNMLASRLDQSFSFRNTNGFEHVDRELAMLIPNNEIKEKVEDIKRLIFPSILEMLQEGVGKSDSQGDMRVISHGFSENNKATRFVSLSYQHRMHPQIAKTSQESFYDGNLKPANTVTEKAEFAYRSNEDAVTWVVDNYRQPKEDKKIENPTEVKNIIQELNDFLKWAAKNPNYENGDRVPYEVAVLTFYREQEALLRKAIRAFTKQNNNFSRFELDNCLINLYTVDKFQGQEADVVLLGFTKVSPMAHYNSPNRLNVALTRARYKLILFGNRKRLERSRLDAMGSLCEFESIKTF